MRDHGGNLDEAMAGFGGTAADWIDLSTGINRQPWPVPPLPPEAWTALPTKRALAALIEAARGVWGTEAPMVALAGAQAAIQLIPHLAPPGRARVLAPTYNEHAAALRAAGWAVKEVSRLEELAGADLAVLVNPNNPDGRRIEPEALLALLPQVGRLVVDESFGDPDPALSLAAGCGRPGLIVLRSFGKFWGLAGVRLGFAIGPAADIAALAERAGPWAVSGPALEIGRRALLDTAWAEATRQRLAENALRLDALVARAGWELIGGTGLFRLYRTPEGTAAQARLARHRIWSRIFPARPDWLRLGLPGSEEEWKRMEAALKGPKTFGTEEAAVLSRLLHWRRDVRHFRRDPVPDEVLRRLRVAVDSAPSVGNARPWRIFRVEDAGLRSAVRVEFARCNGAAASLYSGDQARTYAKLKLAGLEAAPVQFAVFTVTDPDAGHGLGRQTMPETLRQSTAMAIHTLWLAARAENLGLGMVSIVEPKRIEELFEVPEGWEFAAYLCLGWPAFSDDTPLLHRNGWQQNCATDWEIR
ncbi:putative threonine-phosphate decarboxylase/cob(II)yrinic acid a,c-diamide reductase (plasmid) [Acidiphilium multivorum AIU301]|uniref:threonine-phosphate decarboxylase n=2 Tax=Acidiphilium multivorum TaxID=62140 RepID=F0J6Z7_ACIMA|nr:threonine-phosphate decarboxylase CobD [Acidiphilium multivorum]BAJ82864.1 putative threonine-phosphate decarboxylase/cob(II)yrinic acid a,c-diamide reductase [Acidiphilium multivorum AIU301]